jgi:hypothetical protein
VIEREAGEALDDFKQWATEIKVRAERRGHRCGDELEVPR